MINEIEFDILNNLYNSSKGRAQNKNDVFMQVSLSDLKEYQMLIDQGHINQDTSE